MAHSPLVSVIIPTYNRARVVCHAIDSVLAQSYTATEIIVVDDGSTDNTLDELRSYGERIRLVRQGNSGPAIARNRGIAEATGEFVAFLDSDDLWVPEKLSRQIECLTLAGPSVSCCLCNCTVLFRDGGRTSTFAIADTLPVCSRGLWLNPAEVLLDRFVLFSQAALVRRSVLDSVGHFDETLRFGEDYDLPLRLALEGPWCILGDELVIYHDDGPGSWARRALQEEVRLRQDLLRMRLKAAATLEADGSDDLLCRLSAREVRRERRKLAAAELKRSDYWGAAYVGRVWERLERVRRGVYRRLPVYPRIRVQPL